LGKKLTVRCFSRVYNWARYCFKLKTLINYNKITNKLCIKGAAFRVLSGHVASTGLRLSVGDIVGTCVGQVVFHDESSLVVNLFANQRQFRNRGTKKAGKEERKQTNKRLLFQQFVSQFLLVKYTQNFGRFSQ
jgi:hypothetical protein